MAATAALSLGLSWLLMSGCATRGQRDDAMASRLDFHKSIVRGAAFSHVIYRSAVQGAAAVLHVYIEGDGSPFERRSIIAADPTSRDPLMLRLMSRDSATSVYLGRPCYLGLNKESACNPEEWTSRRFAPEIIDSMESVLRGEIARTGAVRVELFGHSGGGTLAVLLAQRVEAVTRVITIAPTLDIDAWCALHAYTPLTGSINPVSHRSRGGLEVIHWVGEKDTNTPPLFVRTAAQSRGDSVHVVAGFDHHCCWIRMWKDILNDSVETER